MLILRKVTLCWIALAWSCCCAYAAAGTPSLAHYHRDAWTSKEGAPNDILSIAQTTDGWLWLATSNGLYRFDGVRFEQFDPRPGDRLLDLRIANLYAAPDGALWFGYINGGGISELRRGRLRLHAPAQPRMGYMVAAHRGQDGALWAATANGLLRYHGGAWTAPGLAHGLSGGWAKSTFVDQYDNVWVNNDHRLFVRRHGEARFLPAGPDKDSLVVRQAPDGRLWMDAGKQITMVEAPHAGPALPPRAGQGPMVSEDWLFDRAGNFWTSDCPASLCLIHAGALVGKTSFAVADTPHDALPDQGRNRGSSRAIFEDREGNIWVSTSEGLERYRPDRIDRLEMDNRYVSLFLGNDGPNAFWVVAAPPGDLWHVAAGAAQRVPGASDTTAVFGRIGHPALFASGHGPEQRAEGQTQATPVVDQHGQALPPFNGAGGVFDGKDYWAFDIVRGLLKLKDGRWYPLAELGYPPGARRFGFDRRSGVWLVYDDKVVDTRPTPWRAYGKAEGLDIGRLQRLVEFDEVLALGTTGVAVRIGTRFHPLRTHHPHLLVNTVASTQTANGDLWINSRSGLLRVLAADWKAWQARPQGLLNMTVFDGADGVSGARGANPGPMVTTDNGKRVWFADQKGLASIDSTAIAQNRTAPPVEVVRLRAGAQAYFADGVNRLAAGTRNLSLDYTALTFIMPERIRFKYRLDGMDHAWQDGGARRTVDYTNLGPGDYRFQVLAANEDGVWGTRPATMHFSIAPLFTQTWWFYGFCSLLALGALSLLYRARVRSVRKHTADRMHERLYERERIARSLHDTYLQSVQGLLYVLQGLAHRQPAADGMRAPLDRAIELADDVLIQGREQVMGLRMAAQGATSLAQSLAEVGQMLAENHAMACTVTSSGAAQALRGHVMEELFYIGREALGNAFRHAQGTRVDVVLHYDARQFTLAIQDDGIGLPAAMLAHGKRDDHWGLPGMRERADTVQGKLTIANVPGGGARIVLAVPARSAYVGAGPGRQALARWWRKRRGA